jgi:hypothetical protein
MKRKVNSKTNEFKWRVVLEYLTTDAGSSGTRDYQSFRLNLNKGTKTQIKVIIEVPNPYLLHKCSGIC